MTSAGASPNRVMREPSPVPSRASDDLVNGLGTLDAHELLVQPAVEVAQPLGVDAELVEDGGVKVLHVQAVADGVGAEVVGLADGHAALHAAAGHPHGEAGG